MSYQRIFYALMLIPLCMFGQAESPISEAYKSYHNINKEALFVHLNKTSYLIGEEIWCKGYVFDSKYQDVAATSTNLYVGVYNSEGERLKHKLCRIQGGTARTNILLDKNTFSTGTYYIKAFTQQMKDNNSDLSFVQEIQVYGESILPLPEEKNTEKTYDIQFLPEGGHLVQNTTHTIGFKAINDKGEGVFASGTLYDENNEEIDTFESNSLGIGKIEIPNSTATSYSAKVVFEEDKTVDVKLPEIKPFGISVAVNVLKRDTISIQLNTNKATLPNIGLKEYSVMIHKDGFVRSMPFSFKDETSGTLSIPKERLYNGVNTLTLFDGKTPIIERMFFNPKKGNGSVVVKNAVAGKDKATFSLFLVKNQPLLRNANVSISVLPEATKSYNPTHSIMSSFYLKPYVNGSIENPKYYFPNNTITKMKALDALLITQGWSKYNWNSIFSGNKFSATEFMNGITIKGKVNFPTKNVRGIFLHDSKNHKSRYINVDASRSFEIPNLFLEEGEKLRFSYVDHNKNFSRPKLFLRYTVSDTKDVLSKNSIIDHFFTNEKPNFSLPTNFFTKDAESLYEVVLKGENKKKKKERDPMMVNGRVTQIDEEKYRQFPRVIDFIQNNGFDVSEYFGKVKITSRKPLTLGGLSNAKQSSAAETTQPGVSSGSSGSTPGSSSPLALAALTRNDSEEPSSVGNVSPLLFIDNVLIPDANILFGYSMANVEKIIIDKSGLGYGFRGTGGVIKIFTRKTPLIKTDGFAKRDSYLISPVPLGFSPPKEYYIPKYTSFSNETFEQYGALDWKPNVYVPRKGFSEVEVYHKGVKSIALYIEGMTLDGTLISVKRIINIK